MHEKSYEMRTCKKWSNTSSFSDMLDELQWHILHARIVCLCTYLQASSIKMVINNNPPCMLGNFSCFCSHLLTFFKINCVKKFIQEHYQSVKQF